MKKLEWSTEKRIINDLIPYDKNPRQMSEKQINDLKKSLKKFNLVEIPAIDKDNKVIAGHQRLKVLQLLGRGNEKIDVRVPNRKLTKKEFERYLITSNAVHGDWDFDLLKNFEVGGLAEAGLQDIDLTKLYENEEVIEEDFDLDKEVESIKETTTKTGDVFQLGRHRLICGDSTDSQVLKRLVGGKQVSMIYSDPPFNINYDYSGGLGGNSKYGAKVKDDRTDLEYKNFLKKTMVAALEVAKPSMHIFYWSDQTYVGLIQELYRELGITNKRVCLWLKNNQNPTPGIAFNKCYEPCTYGVRGKPYLAPTVTNLNEVLNKEITTGNSLIEEVLDQLDVWLVKRLPTSEYQHATAKPPKLHEKAIRRCTKPGDIILDSFGGSGSTLIAGHQLGRTVYLVEKEPVFCDVIVNRFEKLTGVKAKRSRYEEKES